MQAEKGVFPEEGRTSAGAKESLRRHSRNCKISSLARVEKARYRKGPENGRPFEPYLRIMDLT